MLRNSGLRVLPDDLMNNLPDIELFRLLNSKVSHLPDSMFAANPKLSHVVFVNNSLTSVPANLFSGTQALTLVLLSNNEITSLPAALLAGQRQLFAFGVNDNLLSELPAGLLDHATNMVGVLLHDNLLTELPPGLFDATRASLAIATMHNNQLERVPDIASSAVLQFLSLAQNNIAAADFRNVSGALETDTNGNPSVCKSGIDLDTWQRIVLCECAVGYHLEGQSACMPTLCPAQVPLPHGLSQCSERGVGARCNVTCEAGFSSVARRDVTSEQFVCGSTGQWLGSLQCSPQLYKPSLVVQAGSEQTLPAVRPVTTQYSFRNFYFQRTNDHFISDYNASINARTGAVTVSLPAMTQENAEALAATSFISTNSPFSFEMGFDEWQVSDTFARRAATVETLLFVVSPEELYSSFRFYDVSERTATVGHEFSCVLPKLELSGFVPTQTAYALAPGSQLPDGLTLDSVSGRVDGVPAEAGTFQVEIWMQERFSNTALLAANYSLVVGPPLEQRGATQFGTVSQTFSNGNTGLVGGFPGPLVFELVTVEHNLGRPSDPLPSGLTLNDATGVISGIPTEAGTHVIRLLARDVNNATLVLRDSAIRVFAQLNVSWTLSLPSGRHPQTNKKKEKKEKKEEEGRNTKKQNKQDY